MKTNKNDDFFNYFIRGMDRKAQAQLNLMYTHYRLIEEIIQEVLSRISATVDVTEIFDAIDGLNEKIESLGK